MSFSNFPTSPTLFQSFLTTFADHQQRLHTTISHTKSAVQTRLSTVLGFLSQAQQNDDTSDLHIIYSVYLYHNRENLQQSLQTLQVIASRVNSAVNQADLDSYEVDVANIQKSLATITPPTSFTQAQAHEFLEHANQELTNTIESRKKAAMTASQPQPALTQTPFPPRISSPLDTDDADWYNLSERVAGLEGGQKFNAGSFLAQHWKKFVPLLLIASFASTSTQMGGDTFEMAEFHDDLSGTNHVAFNTPSIQHSTSIRQTVAHLTPSLEQVNFNNQLLRAFSPGLKDPSGVALLSPSILNSIRQYNNLYTQQPPSRASGEPFSTPSLSQVPITPMINSDNSFPQQALPQQRQQQPTPFFSPFIEQTELLPSPTQPAPITPLKQPISSELIPLTPVPVLPTATHRQELLDRDFTTPPIAAVSLAPAETAKKSTIKSHQVQPGDVAFSQDVKLAFEMWEEESSNFTLSQATVVFTAQSTDLYGLTELEHDIAEVKGPVVDLYCAHHVSEGLPSVDFRESEVISEPVEPVHDAIVLKSAERHRKAKAAKKSKKYQETVTDPEGLAAAAAIGAIIAVGVVTGAIEDQDQDDDHGVMKKKGKKVAAKKSVKEASQVDEFDSVQESIDRLASLLESTQQEADVLTESLTSTPQPTTSRPMTRSRSRIAVKLTPSPEIITELPKIQLVQPIRRATRATLRKSFQNAQSQGPQSAIPQSPAEPPRYRTRRTVALGRAPPVE